MSEIVDEFYTARNLLYLGAYPQCIATLGNLPVPGSLEPEKESLKLRAYIGQQNYTQALREISSQTPLMQAIRQLALLKQQQQQQGAMSNEAVEAITKEIDELAKDTDNLSNAVFVAVAAQVYIGAQKYDDAFKILHVQPRSLECVAMTVSGYLAIHRVDLAQKLIEQVRSWSEDAPIAQLAEAWTNLHVGGAKLTEAYYIFEELAQAASVKTPSLLNAMAVCKLHLKQYPEAISFLQEAQQLDANDPNVLANLFICASLTGETESKTQYRSQLEQTAPNHPFVVAMEAKSVEFDALASQYAN
ncbi:hypothetical protein LPJ78_001964 [Coemansia sp. RSA 989]|nr:coatomer epsilon subunit-domain-containing protein [Coemansia mojavensis]KAJ1738380.1 hypothetical protein LPJ68_005599 [Coemansia sp. RSA 1086]KAJ1751104.1 hypothetical protein LPJ79_002381 [Coemansia sp. RSA 1821]KAJ1866307.1 hypothetical protein LPJ78_001964 [Coemansia sp. RSA 989]KAJ1870246.1 hypothetical protein LPJ55_004804 [Coemansia sp. RSA 990]KAJ2633605.1 hypothetical protein H4R22_000352 [Coemansia sp. RSA 1290]KAJ2653033.1 hypothetical protein IWW40_000687 [Coemansia sp. RSA 12